ncbi:hypothetical protein V8F33_005782 [Rhypophila sp. PSN 637]
MSSDASAANLCASSEKNSSPANTWLPLLHLQSQCARYLEKDEQSPFLILENSDSIGPDELGAKWAFLHTHFSPGKDDNIRFLLAILDLIQHHDDDPINPARVLAIYITIDSKCTSAVERQAERKMG